MTWDRKGPSGGNRGLEERRELPKVAQRSWIWSPPNPLRLPSHVCLCRGRCVSQLWPQTSPSRLRIPDYNQYPFYRLCNLISVYTILDYRPLMFSFECFLSLPWCPQSRLLSSRCAVAFSTLSTNRSGRLLIVAPDCEIKAVFFSLANTAHGDLAAYFPSSPHLAKVGISDSGHPAHWLSLEHLPLFPGPRTLPSLLSLPEMSFLPLLCLLRDSQASEANFWSFFPPWSFPLLSLQHVPHPRLPRALFIPPGALVIPGFFMSLSVPSQDKAMGSNGDRDHTRPDHHP